MSKNLAQSKAPRNISCNMFQILIMYCNVISIMTWPFVLSYHVTVLLKVSPSSYVFIPGEVSFCYASHPLQMLFPLLGMPLFLEFTFLGSSNIFSLVNLSLTSMNISSCLN